jgi:hypothetical protein
MVTRLAFKIRKPGSGWRIKARQYRCDEQEKHETEEPQE